ncbi:unnamed protein product [Trifolium pratense]|uniref:Uncharacterized protein n=1 Tax=Trifolium pratense TaxID=57577 RepID=A0ACB0IXP1_TRIPR|nr:unnamed protein product [Trifolium pratense]
MHQPKSIPMHLHPSWEKVCLPKDKGDLGIKNLALFNLALLCKWKWRCLNERNTIWYEFLNFRYGPFPSTIFTSNIGSVRRKDSLCSMGGRTDEEAGWFTCNINSVLGDGSSINFWREKWIGSEPLCSTFPNLFRVERHKVATVANKGRWDIGIWRWIWDWSEALSLDAAAELVVLKGFLVGITPHMNVEDKHRWIANPLGIYSVKSCYSILISIYNQHLLQPDVERALHELWLNDIPSKVSVFCWRLLQNKLATRDNLSAKGIITNFVSRSCTFCFNVIESCDHLFFSCPLAKRVWDGIHSWMGTNFISLETGWGHFLAFGSFLKSSRHNKVRHLIWCTTT